MPIITIQCSYRGIVSLFDGVLWRADLPDRDERPTCDSATHPLPAAGEHLPLARFSLLVGQEIRHALNLGPVRHLLGELSDSTQFWNETDGTVNPKRMADRECVARFLGLRALGGDAYAGKPDDFLAKTMKSLNGGPNSHGSLTADFRSVMSLASEILGQDAFRKPPRIGPNGRRSPVNKPLVESLSIAPAAVPDDRAELLVKRKKDLVRRLGKLMGDSDFFESMSVGTKTTRQVKIRFGRPRDLARGVL